MQACSFAESDAVLHPPAGMTAEQVAALSIMRGTINGQPVVVSCWKVTPSELEEIQKTGRVWLVVMGATMPPVMVEGCKPILPPGVPQ